MQLQPHGQQRSLGLRKKKNQAGGMEGFLKKGPDTQSSNSAPEKIRGNGMKNSRLQSARQTFVGVVMLLSYGCALCVIFMLCCTLVDLVSCGLAGLDTWPRRHILSAGGGCQRRRGLCRSLILK